MVSKLSSLELIPLSHDLALRYPYIAKDLLGISIDTNQFFEVEDFIKLYDSSGINAPLNYKLHPNWTI